MFVRRQQGIERLSELLQVLCRKELSLHMHSATLFEIQGILFEIRGVKEEIEKLDREIGLFFPDEAKVAAKKALENRLKNLIGQLESISKNENKRI